ncbi:MAG: hypothetical protein LBL72_01615 [Candidatus Accumulibacter sp.]|jgi:hypothetical protein|nr:hypothetical protein [Accumulibacter sp.]
MLKISRIAGVIALLLFSNAQYQGWSLFTGDGSSGSRSPSSRGYHK